MFKSLTDKQLSRMYYRTMNSIKPKMSEMTIGMKLQKADDVNKAIEGRKVYARIMKALS